MPPPKKPSKDDALRQTRQKPPESHEDAPQRDFTAYRDPETVAVSTRLERRDRELIERHAAERGLKAAQVVRAWILEAMKREGLR